MATTNNSGYSASLSAAMLAGAGIGFILISIFVSGVDHPDPHWPELWFIRPLIVTPISGAIGGSAFYYLITRLTSGGMNKTAALILSLIVLMIALWLGVVAGLDGTMWD